MVKPVFRRKSIDTKVSEEEYQLAEWVREVPPRERANRRGGRRGPLNGPCWWSCWRCGRSC